MQKIILTAACVILVALAGCSNPAQAPETPAPSPVQTATQTPFPTKELTVAAASTATPTGPRTTNSTPEPVATAKPEPTSVATQAPTPTDKDDTPTGVLSPLNLHETDVINSEISDAELACLREIRPVLHLRWAWILTGSGNQEERIKIIGCLEDETAARIFLADIAQGVGPLSLETSTCVRAAFNEIDPRSMLLAKAEGFPEDTLNSATVLFFVTMACLNDDEWETVDRSLREDSELRDWMRCMIGKLGGPEEMAAAMTKGAEGDQEALAEAAAHCAEKMESAPSQAPATPTATPEPVPTSEQSSIAPLNPDDPADLLSRLTQYERDCITDLELLAGFLSKPPRVDYEDATQQIGCLRDETLLHLDLAHLAWYFQDLGGNLRADTASCIQDGLKGISIGILIHEIHTAKPSLVRQMHSAFWDLTVFYCMSEEEAALAAPDSGITVEEYDAMICTVDAFGGLQGLNQAYRNTSAEEFTEELLTNSYACQRG